MTGTRTLIVERDPRTAAYVRDVLVRDGGSVRIASGANAAITMASEYPPDMLVIDLDLGGAEQAIDLVTSMRRRWRMAVIFLAGEVSPAAIDAIAAIDTASIVSKPIDRRQLEAALRLAWRRHASAPRPRGAAVDAARLDGLAMLRPREREVARLLLRNRVPAIAEQLGISAHTVRNHLKGAFKRTGTRSQQDLLEWLAHFGYPGMPLSVDYQPASSAGADGSAAGGAERPTR